MTDSDGARQVAKSATERHVASQKNTTLTDAEREAVERVAEKLEVWKLQPRDAGDAATLRGLLERL
jgi:hypothetical protein